eukprot:1161064-Pelagomonas_calceolata.AAC.7
MASEGQRHGALRITCSSESPSAKMGLRVTAVKCSHSENGLTATQGPMSTCMGLAQTSVACAEQSLSPAQGSAFFAAQQALIGCAHACCFCMHLQVFAALCLST